MRPLALQPESQGRLFATFSLGELKVVALSDGYADMNTSSLRSPDGGDAPPAVMAKAQLTAGKLRLQVNAFLILAPDGNVLIDTGSSNVWRATTGRIYDALEEAGVARTAIMTIAITHTHVDHINGLVMPDGTVAFPAAEAICVPENELQLFSAESRLSPLSSLVRPLKDGGRIGKSITAQAAYGHEIGHTAFLVESEAKRLLVWGDIVHAPEVQFAHPDIAWEFDADPGEARRTRAKLLQRAAREHLPVAGAHLAFPGIGLVRKRGEAFAFAPLA